MKLTINTAENGYIVDVHDYDDSHYYFVAVDIDDVTKLIVCLLEDETGKLDLQEIVYKKLPDNG